MCSMYSTLAAVNRAGSNEQRKYEGRLFFKEVRRLLFISVSYLVRYKKFPGSTPGNALHIADAPSYLSSRRREDQAKTLEKT